MIINLITMFTSMITLGLVIYYITDMDSLKEELAILKLMVQDIDLDIHSIMNHK